MSKPQVAQQSVLMDVEPGAAGPEQAKAPVDKTFRRYDQDQPMLLAPDLRDWLAADHPARWVDDLVEHGLDLSAIYADYTEVRGAPPDEPRLMLKILIYGYSDGVTSSRALERRCHDDIAFRFLTAQAAPDFVAISWVPGPARGGAEGVVHPVADVVRPGWSGVVGQGCPGWDEGAGGGEPASGDELRPDGAG